MEYDVDQIAIMFIRQPTQNFMSLFRRSQLALAVLVTFGLAVIGLSTMVANNSSYSRGIQLAQKVFTDSVASAILTGNDYEVRSKCNSFAADRGVIRLEIIDYSGRSLCSVVKKPKGLVAQAQTYVYFDIQKTKVAATIEFAFDSEIIPRSLAALGAIILICGTSIFGGCLFILGMFKRRLIDPLAQMAKVLAGGDLLAIKDLNEALANPVLDEVKDLLLGTKIMAERLLELQMEMVEKAKSDAIAGLTHMLAHDVRKPFSMMLLLLNGLRRAKSLSEVQDVLTRSQAEVLAALAAASNMIEDILETGSARTPMIEDVSVINLLDSAVESVCRIYPDSQIVFDYNLLYKSGVAVELAKVQRALTNILANAVQAMNGCGRIWVRTRLNDSLVEVCIGNDGPSIPEEDLQHIFESFFTKGKKDGTGMGLAIAKKVVESHGGSIVCRSLSTKGVEFYLTLPKSQNESMPTGLKGVAADVQEYGVQILSSKENLSGNEKATAYESELKQQLALQNLKVLIIDDDEKFRNSLREIIQNASSLKSGIDLVFVADSIDAILALDDTFEAAIFNYELSNPPMNWVDTIKAAHHKVPNLHICFHSPSLLVRSDEVILRAGSVDVFPKLGRAQLLEFFLNVVRFRPRKFLPSSSQKMRNSKQPLVVPNEVNQVAATLVSSEGCGIAVLDDSLLFLKEWLEESPAKPMFVFESPESFWQYAADNRNFLGSLCAIVTDNNFGLKSKTSGIEFARSIEGVPIFLCTAGDYRDGAHHGGIKTIPKQVLSWEALKILAARFAQPEKKS